MRLVAPSDPEALELGLVAQLSQPQLRIVVVPRNFGHLHIG